MKDERFIYIKTYLLNVELILGLNRYRFSVIKREPIGVIDVGMYDKIGLKYLIDEYDY